MVTQAGKKGHSHIKELEHTDRALRGATQVRETAAALQQQGSIAVAYSKDRGHTLSSPGLVTAYMSSSAGRRSGAFFRQIPGGTRVGGGPPKCPAPADIDI